MIEILQLDNTLRAKMAKETIDTLCFVKIKNCYASEDIENVKRQSTERETIFASHLSEKDIYKTI